MFDKKLTSLKNYFGIMDYGDWQKSVTLDMLARRPGVGPKLIDYLRLLLAQRGLTLKNDRTPEYWKKNLNQVKILNTLGDDEEGSDRGELFPWTLLIDSAEQEPFTFQNHCVDFSAANPTWIVPTDTVCLGRYPDSLGDYTLDCCRGRCHVERKSKNDAHGTILGFKGKDATTGRRDRFEKELENLSKIEAGAVVVECSMGELIGDPPESDYRTYVETAAILESSIHSFQRKYKGVAWFFCDSREHAERTTLRWLFQYARAQAKQRKLAERSARSQQSKSFLASDTVLTTV